MHLVRWLVPRSSGKWLRRFASQLLHSPSPSLAPMTSGGSSAAELQAMPGARTDDLVFGLVMLGA